MSQGVRHKVGARDVARPREEYITVLNDDDGERVTLTAPCWGPLSVLATNDKPPTSLKRRISTQAGGRTSRSSIEDEELLYRAVMHARSSSRRELHPRWFAIMEAFGLGVAPSMELCKRFGLDPHQLVSRDDAEPEVIKAA